MIIALVKMAGIHNGSPLWARSHVVSLPLEYPMNLKFASFAFATGLITAGSSFAQVPAAAPAGSTGLCKDGSYSSKETKKGACEGHKGVKDWFGPSAAAAAPSRRAAPASAPAPATAAVGAKDASASSKAGTPAPSTAPAAGGGPGQVWVNSSSKVYHCSGTKYYGKTKQGEYMTEAAAKAAGNHADHGKACS